jgi:Cdc6-like AAA superfamily ATPase
MNQIASFLKHFEENNRDETVMRCIYVVGPSGSGKTTFVTKALKSLNYDIIQYTASDVRNKPNMDTMNLSHTSGTNIISMFRRCQTKLAIVMDDIECMNNGDKGGINSLIKLVRPKKNKKQKDEPTTLIPIICVGTPRTDKKMKELMKCCLVIEIPEPSHSDMLAVCRTHLPSKPHLHESLARYAGSDYKKIIALCNLLQKSDIPMHVFEPMPYVEDVKMLTKRIMNTCPEFCKHSEISEADRTIVSLLWHENVADILDFVPQRNELYANLLDHLCYVDYLDRVTFQKQIWVLNEFTSLLKTFSTTNILRKHTSIPVKDVRFTKVLTKYSTEYNNVVFIQRICQDLGVEKYDLFCKLHSLRELNASEIAAQMNLSVVDVNRAYRYMEAIGY